MKLTPKQELFAQTYIKTGNATEAYKTAYNASKMKNETVTERASRLLKEYKISTRLKELQEQLENKHSITKDKILKELASIAFVQESEFYHDDGSVKLLSELNDEQKSALSQYGFKSVHVGDGQYEDVPVFKAQDKIKAIEAISKLLGYFEPEKQEITHGGVVTILPEKNDIN